MNDLPFEILRLKFETLRKANPRFSLRAMAKRVGMHSGALSGVLNGKRKISRKKAEALATKFGLDPVERMQFLSHFPETTARPVKQSYQELGDAEFEVIRGWAHFAILSLMKTSGFTSSAPWISDRLGISIRETQDCIDRLLKTGLISRDKDGELRRASASFRTGDDRLNRAIQEAHEETASLAIHSLKRDPVDQRDLSSVTMAIDPLKLPKAKEAIRKFQNEISSLLEDGKQTSVYRLSVQLFPLCRILLFALALGGSAQAGDLIGNGGDVLICEGIDQIRMLDQHEAERRGIVIQLGAPELTVRQKVEVALKRLSRLDPDRASTLSHEAEFLLADAEAFDRDSSARTSHIRFTDDVLSDIDDSEETAIPVGCQKAQLVIRVRAVVPEDRPFEIHRPFWVRMSSDQRALAVLHEVWYGEALQNGAHDSRFARYLNTWTSSAEFEAIQFKDYASILELGRSSFQIILPFRRNICGKSFQMELFGNRGTGLRTFESLPIKTSGVDLLPYEVTFSDQGVLETTETRLASPVSSRATIRVYLDRVRIRGSKGSALYPEFSLDSECRVRAMNAAFVQRVRPETGPTGKKNPGRVLWDEHGRYQGD